MIQLDGKYGSAIVFTDLVEPEAVGQVIGLLNQPFAAGAHVRLMPDIHAGAGCTIGTTMRITDKVCPNLVGVDIGCGMKVIRLAERHIDFDKLDRAIREKVPAGFEIRSEAHPMADRIDLSGLRCAKKLDVDRAYKSIGSLGGGNHFIEVDVAPDGTHYLVVHTGSRHLGLEVAKHYMDRAWSELTQYSKEEIDVVIRKLKSAGRQKEIQSFLRGAKKECSVPKDLAYLQGGALDDYIADMWMTQRYADINRTVIAKTILEEMGWTGVSEFTTVHNYIDLAQKILRKGAVAAYQNERLIIPINMRDGSLICTGKGNPEWNFSAPHGAGRLYSRSKAKEMFTVEEFRAEMEGIYSTSVNQSTLDESPMAYKPIERILENITDTVDVDMVIKPVYNFKAGS